MSDNHLPVTKSVRSVKPKVSVKLAELLDRLDLSSSILLEEDAWAIERSSSASSGIGSVKNADWGCGYPNTSSTGNTMDRKTLLEELAAVRAKVETCMMMRVYGESNEEDPLRNKYLKKLSKYEQLREELESGEEDFRVEITQLRKDLRKKTDEADTAIEQLLSKQRAAAAQAYTNGKPLSAKEVQAMITRELAKMKDISKIRVRYARLRDSLVEKEVIFDALKILTPNLDRKDYERLEAENFYYRHELRLKEEEGERLARRQERISRQLQAIQHKRKNLLRLIKLQRDTIQKLKQRIVQTCRQKQMKRKKEREVQQYFDKFEFILGLRLYPEVHAKMEYFQNQHKEWLEKVARLMAEIKNRNQSLKDVEPRKNIRRQKQTSDEEGTTDDDTPSPRKSRRPPLGGGFLQSLYNTGR
ncbi:cilia- and flagella-associated protein 184-like isoform X2 [Neodiprion pinetum]|uniref:cilia- and flagella-associated protein 184-like isoform X2 n=1 Tax=Neodiprion pinetum TaxID=441929 RepID=UPI001EDD134D|nr:golgin subfamily A member 6-like protein 22 isoform X2 [Neodiprion pinetum]